jgi:hypothetical protein
VRAGVDSAGAERGDLVNRGALQGGLVATLTDVTTGRLAERKVPTGHDVTTADKAVHCTIWRPSSAARPRRAATVVPAGRAFDLGGMSSTSPALGWPLARRDFRGARDRIL